MNIYGKISALFIKNKQLSLLLLGIIILWGFVSFVLIPKQYNPDIVAPAFLIDVQFPGATVDEVYQIVTKPLEDVLNEIPGVENIYSKSYQGGRSIVVAEFYVGEDLEKSMIILRQRISSRLNLAPLGVSEPYIYSIDPDDLPIKTIALYSDKVNKIDLRKAAHYLKDELKQVRGTSIVNIIGGRKRQFKIVLDPKRMQESKTSLSEINQALNNTSLLKPIGAIKAEDKYFNIETQEQAITTKDIEDIIITSNYEQFLRIKDVAQVTEGEEEYESYVNLYKKDVKVEDAVFITVAKLKGKNIINVSKAVEEELESLKKSRPYLNNINIETLKDEGQVAQEEISGLTTNLIQAIVIVFLVLLLFLNHRASLIVAFSIPITLLTVIALGFFFGYTINRITLFALILSLGLLVDNATVVIENIVANKTRYPKLSKLELISKSVAEVGMGLFMSTLTTVLAFIPMAFVTGMMGPYMGPLPFFVSGALIISLIFSYTLNPWLASVFCQDSIKSDITARCGIICQALTSSLAKYKSLLDSLLSNRSKRKKFLKTLFILTFIVLLFPVLQIVKFRMLPKADREQVFAYIDLDRGTSLERTYRVADEIAQLMVKEKEVKSVQSFIGIPPVLDFNGLFRGVSERNQPYHITLKLNLTHKNDRKSASENLAVNYRKIMLKALMKYPDARLKVVEDPPGPPVKSTFYLKIKSENTALLYQTANEIEKLAKKIKGVVDVDTSTLEPQIKYVLSVDKEAAARAKVSVESISQELETIFSGRIISVYHSDYNHEQEYIVLKFNRDLRDSINDLDNIFIPNELSNHVPVSRFIKIMDEPQEDVISGDNRQRTIYISGEMQNRSVTYAAIDMLKLLRKYKAPNQATKLTKFSLLSSEYLVDGESVKVEIGGEWELTIKVFRDLGLAMLVAIVLIYLVLVAQFSSFIIPLLIMGTIPLALIGVMPGFALMFLITNLYFSATSMIGVIALAGIVVNNAIIFVEYVQQASTKYATFKETLIDAGLTRARPILLTSTTTVLGSLTIAADPVWSGLAWSIFFGLSVSTFLTLIVFPTLLYEFLGETWFQEQKMAPKA